MSMTPKFYFNTDANICVSEQWLIAYLRRMNNALTEEGIKSELSRGGYPNWVECDVSIDIFSNFC